MKTATQIGIKTQPNVSVIKVCQLNKVLPNGYFKIGTEYGIVYISASKLNEDLFETETEATEEPKLTNKEKWDKYEEAFFHEV